MNNLAIIGCGKMGEAVLSGLLAAGNWGSNDIKVTTRRTENCERLGQEYGVSASTLNVEAMEWAQIVVLAVKPKMVSQVLQSHGVVEALRGKMLISLCAGVAISKIESMVEECAVVRAMSNAPAVIMQGMTVLSPGNGVNEQNLSSAKEIFGAVGRCLVLDERHINAVTGLSGSGPAFLSVIMDAMADGGVMMGLPRGVAVELVAQTCRGAAQLVLSTGQHPALLKDTVTTPGGCTIAGLLVLEDGKIRSTLARAIQEATTVAAGLGG